MLCAVLCTVCVCVYYSTVWFARPSACVCLQGMHSIHLILVIRRWDSLVDKTIHSMLYIRILFCECTCVYAIKYVDGMY